MPTDAERRLEAIRKVVDRHFTSDPYHAGRVAHQMKVDSAINSMYRIREILREEPPMKTQIDPRRVYPDDGTYDLNLTCSGSGWLGTFRQLVAAAARDILIEGPFGPVRIALDNDVEVVGVLYDSDDNTLTIIQSDHPDQPKVFEIENVLEFRI